MIMRYINSHLHYIATDRILGSRSPWIPACLATFQKVSPPLESTVI